jgi:hypothetical protein
LAGSVHAWAEDGFDLSDHAKCGAWRRVEYYRAYGGAGFNRFAGDALLTGPICFFQFTNKLFLSAAYSTQIAGHPAGDANFLDLTNFTLNKARLKLIWEF